MEDKDIKSQIISKDLEQINLCIKEDSIVNLLFVLNDIIREEKMIQKEELLGNFYENILLSRDSYGKIYKIEESFTSTIQLINILMNINLEILQKDSLLWGRIPNSNRDKLINFFGDAIVKYIHIIKGRIVKAIELASDKKLASNEINLLKHYLRFVNIHITIVERYRKLNKVDYLKLFTNNSETGKLRTCLFKKDSSTIDKLGRIFTKLSL